MRRSVPRRTQLRTRVLAGVLAITLVAFVAFDVVAVTGLRQYLLGRTDATLTTVLNLSANHLGRLVADAQGGTPGQVLHAALGTYDYDYLAFVPDHGQTLVLDAEPGLAPRLPTNFAALASAGQPETVRELDGPTPLRLRARPVPGGILVASSSLDTLDHTVGRLELIIVIGSIAALALIGVGVGVVVRRGMHPLETMASEADRINAGELAHRVGTDDSRSEVGRLGMALNGMLSRIETSVGEREASQERMRAFFADASHELRTPLASLRANAELYQQGALPERSQVDEAMRRIGLEAQRMSRLVDDMLRLARLDQLPDQPHHRVDFTKLVGDCVQRARQAYPEHEWHSDISAGLVVVGDDELLRGAVDNLVSNVGVHTPPGSSAAVTALRRDDAVVIKVSDDGPGVPAARLPRIFERFYRGDVPSARPGSGLGLAIVSETAATHHGSVNAECNPPHGLLVVLRLPAGGGAHLSDRIDMPL